MMLTISVTTIEEFNKLLIDSEYPEERLIKYITEKPAPNKFMELGTGFHDVIQNPHDRQVIGDTPDTIRILSKNEIAFPFKLIQKCYDYIDHGFPFEVRREHIYKLSNGEEVKVIAKADQLKGNRVKEIKTNWSYFRYEKYHNSIQWKYYLEIFDAQGCDYIVFCMNDNARGIELKSIENFGFDRYEGIERENLLLLQEFTEYIHLRNLEDYFKGYNYANKQNKN